MNDAPESSRFAAAGTGARRLLVYALTVGVTFATLGLRLGMDGMLGGRPTLVMFTIPIMLSSYVGGLVPGLVATLLSALAACYFLLPPLHSFAVTSPVDRWQLFCVMLCGIFISLLSESLHRTRRRQTESDELFANAFRLSPDCMVITRLADRRVIRANDALCQLWGAPPEEIIGRPGRDYTNWLREKEREAFIQQLSERGECLDREAELCMSDGRLLVFSLSSRMITFAGEACILTVMRDITDQKRGEATAARLAAIVNSSDDAIIGKTLEGIITTWNPGAEKTFGYTAEEAVGQPMGLLIPPERNAEEPAILARIARGEHVQHFETARLRKDGTRLDISATISPITDANGQVIGASKIARDITVRKAHEREIARLTRLYAALSHVNQAIVLQRTRDELFDKICRTLVESGGFCMAWIGWLDAATHRVQPIAQHGDRHGFLTGAMFYADDRPEGRGAVGTAIRESRPYICNDTATDPRIAPWRETLLRAGHLSAATFPIRQEGTICGVIVVSADETDFFQDREIALLVEAADDVSFALDNFRREESRRQAEAKLEAERTLLRTLFDLLPDYVYIKDTESRFLACNDHCAARFGAASNRDLIGKTDADFFSPESADRFRADELAVLHGKAIINQEESFTRPDGKREVILTNKLPLRDGGGKIVGLIGCGREITELKLAEAALALREAQLRLYVEHSPAAIAMFDRAMNYIIVSRRWRDDFRLGEQPLTGRNHYDVFPDLPTRWKEVHLRCLAGAVEKCEEDAFPRPDGTTDWLRWEVRPWRELDEAIGGLIFFSEDITARKKIEQRAREQLEELLRWQDVMLNREDRVQELKAEVNELLARQHEPARYAADPSS